MSRVNFNVTFNITAEIDIDMNEVIESLMVLSELNGKTIEIYDSEVTDFEVLDSK